MAVAINTCLDVNMFSEVYSEFDDDSHDVMPESLCNMEIFGELYGETEEISSEAIIDSNVMEQSDSISQ